MGRRAKTGSLLLLAVGVAGAAAIHRATHGRWFPRPGSAAVRHAHAGEWVSWNRIPVGAPIEGFSGGRPDDVWAWASRGIMHWDGRTWTRVPGPPDAGSVIGVGEWWGILWVRAVGIYPADGSTERHDWCRVDDRWKRDDDCDVRRPADTPAPTPPGPTPEVAYLRADELAPLWSAHVRRGGLPPIDLTRGYRVGGGELWAVDKTGRWLAHFDGDAWRVDANPVPAFTAIWFAADDDGWAVSDKTLYRWDGRDWTAATAAPERLRSIWGADAHDVWAVGDGGLVLHFDGRAWSRSDVLGGTWLKKVDGRARDDVWVTGCDFAAHWDGKHWTVRTIGRPVEVGGDTCLTLAPMTGGRAFAARGASMFAFADGRWTDGTDPFADEAAPIAREEIVALAGGDGDQIWAVGSEHNEMVRPADSPLVLRRLGGGWRKMNVHVHGGEARAIWARAADDVWVVGTGGLILHFDGHAWTREESGTDEDLIAVHGAGDTIWVVGADGGLLRRRS